MLGDTATAAVRLAAFIELWEDAEPALQPALTAARLRLNQIVGEPNER